MKKLEKYIPFVVLLLALTFNACSDNETDEVITSQDNIILKNNEVRLSQYYNQVRNELNFALDEIQNFEKNQFANNEEIANYLIPLVGEKVDNKIGYYDATWHLENIDNTSNLNLNETGISNETLYYFNELENAYDNNDAQRLIDLKVEFENNYSSNSDMVALATTFAVIDFYEADITDLSKKRECSPSGRSVAMSVVGGAILGARVGFLFGSFLGPAGTAAGAIGGAIAGAVITGIMNIGIQGAACESGI